MPSLDQLQYAFYSLGIATALVSLVSILLSKRKRKNNSYKRNYKNKKR
ncbi:hypothetical protein KQ51_01389 [Candidatus Izimaplasma bacterium HR1]|jgi:LPXTG-motif cell wall-anchored protein|nr:hypothetical protein KQ51_01389 [Candidatus Izimaplasma bacterium HR1]